MQDRFPLDELLGGSLYYPSCGFDGDPVRFLGGNVLSFVYVDYGKTREELDGALRGGGFSGYEIIASRTVAQSDLTPSGWAPPRLRPIDGDPARYRERAKPPFCAWNIFQRRERYASSHGPRRFSLLYLCADGVAAFQALYVANGVLPAAVAIIQPGHGFGGNWTNFADPRQIFARIVLENTTGVPPVLMYGGIGAPDFYMKPCWPNYSHRVCILTKAGGGTIGVWQQAPPVPSVEAPSP